MYIAKHPSFNSMYYLLCLVRTAGLEPAQASLRDFKSLVSTVSPRPLFLFQLT